MNGKSQFDEVFKTFKESYPREITKIDKILGRGAFGEVREIYYKGKVLAGKVIEKEEEDEKTGEELLATELRGQNIIRINRVLKKKINDKYYDLILMEKAVLRDLGKLNEFYHRHNLLKIIIKKPFDEITGNLLLRFYTKQIICGMETLDRNNYIHFDIKPENLLITVNLIIKLSDFSLLKEVKDLMKLPGGTPGYISPEYYDGDKLVSGDIAKKQDYFAFGSSLFYLKYGKALLKYKKYEDERIMNSDRIKDLIQRNIYEVKGKKESDKDYINFQTDLIHCSSECRPSFEEIYRNKWVNKNNNELNRVVMAFESDEEKLIMELEKNDYIIKKEKMLKKQNKYNQVKFRFKKKT